ncbi:MAG TPA: hypothetical protein VIK91_20440 [Nannocystis sp.]
MSTSFLARVSHTLDRFFFAPARPMPLAVLRIGLAATLLAQALQVAPVFLQLYHHDGLLRGALMDAFGPPHLPALGALVVRLTGGGAAESALLVALGLLYLGSLVAMLVGWRTRVAGACAWLLHLVFVMLAPHTNYGADEFASMFLFYAMLAPGAGALALDRRAGRAPAAPRATDRLVLRIMQIHLSFAYCLSGIEKASGEQWWSGEAIWRALTGQGYRLFDLTWLAHWPALAALAGWLVLVIEIGYPLIWLRATRPAWVVAVAAMHAGIGIFMGLHVFAALMIVLTVALFGVRADPDPEAPGAPA